MELWVDKDALAGVLAPIATDRHITLMVNRGYSSQSAMYEASERFAGVAADGREATVLYLGDLDPSGEDMAGDIHDRLNFTFNANAAQFVSKHGFKSYEVDALPPQVLRLAINDTIDEYLDLDRHAAREGLLS